jgi:aminoglycoside 2'-N-acetyltransferase I
VRNSTETLELRIVSCPEAATPPKLRTEVLNLHHQAWASEGQLKLGPTHDPALVPLSILLIENGRVIAALDILSFDVCGFSR